MKEVPVAKSVLNLCTILNFYFYLIAAYGRCKKSIRLNRQTNLQASHLCYLLFSLSLLFHVPYAKKKKSLGTLFLKSYSVH